MQYMETKTQMSLVKMHGLVVILKVATHKKIAVKQQIIDRTQSGRAVKN